MLYNQVDGTRKLVSVHIFWFSFGNFYVIRFLLLFFGTTSRSYFLSFLFFLLISCLLPLFTLITPSPAHPSFLLVFFFRSASHAWHHSHPHRLLYIVFSSLSFSSFVTVRQRTAPRPPATGGNGIGGRKGRLVIGERAATSNPRDRRPVSEGCRLALLLSDYMYGEKV